MNKSIGIFDSGVGGLTIMKEIIKILPDEDIAYFGDTARVPYGTKSRETILQFAIEDILFLLGLEVKLIVIACNTVSSTSLDIIDRYFRIPIIGVIESAVRRAVKATQKSIGIIGTRATIKSNTYNKKIRELGSNIKVQGISCPLFVPFAEEGIYKGKAIEDVAEKYLRPFRNKIDVLILGCTHYPLLKETIGSIVGDSIQLIDSAEEVAKDVKNTLSRLKILRHGKRKARHSFFVTDEPKRFRQLGKRFLGRNIGKVENVSI
ncbi:MAG: glutamate racemase [bacterium]